MASKQRVLKQNRRYPQAEKKLREQRKTGDDGRRMMLDALRVVLGMDPLYSFESVRPCR